MSQEPVQTPWVERRPQQKQLGGRGSEWSRGDEEGLAEGPGTGGVAGPALQLHHQAAAGGGGRGGRGGVTQRGQRQEEVLVLSLGRPSLAAGVPCMGCISTCPRQASASSW